LGKRKSDRSREYLSLEKEIKKLRRSYYAGPVLFSLPAIAVLLLILSIFGVINQAPSERASYNTHFVIENLRGDVIDTENAWHLAEGETLYVKIANFDKYSPEKMSVIKDVILSEKTVEIEDSILHKGPKGKTSTYYHGWFGALKSIATTTKYTMPTQFEIIEGSKSGGDIIITLTNLQSGEGINGFTNSIVDENQHQMLKSMITIYEANKISEEELETILRHEFGHALGLGHSTAPEDLMASNITTEYPYISDCNIDSIVLLYDGGESSQVICEK